jgi:hypothetical protein
MQLRNRCRIRSRKGTGIVSEGTEVLVHTLTGMPVANLREDMIPARTSEVGSRLEASDGI